MEANNAVEEETDVCAVIRQQIEELNVKLRKHEQKSDVSTREITVDPSDDAHQKQLNHRNLTLAIQQRLADPTFTERICRGIGHSKSHQSDSKDIRGMKDLHSDLDNLVEGLKYWESIVHVQIEEAPHVRIDEAPHGDRQIKKEAKSPLEPIKENDHDQKGDGKANQEKSPGKQKERGGHDYRELYKFAMLEIPGKDKGRVLKGIKQGGTMVDVLQEEYDGYRTKEVNANKFKQHIKTLMLEMFAQ